MKKRLQALHLSWHSFWYFEYSKAVDRMERDAEVPIRILEKLAPEYAMAKFKKQYHFYRYQELKKKYDR